jgi:hypothetical protein
MLLIIPKIPKSWPDPCPLPAHFFLSSSATEEKKVKKRKEKKRKEKKRKEKKRKEKKRKEKKRKEKKTPSQSSSAKYQNALSPPDVAKYLVIVDSLHRALVLAKWSDKGCSRVLFSVFGI